MARVRNRIRRTRRWLGIGFNLGVAAALGIGCQSVDPPSRNPALSAYPSGPNASAMSPPNGAQSLTAGPTIIPAAELAATSRPGGGLAALTRRAAANGDPVAGASAPSVGGMSGVAGPVSQSVDTIDLGIALRLGGVDNPTINLAREQIREALAGQLAARSLLLPSVNIGGNYHYHTGPLQASFGQIRYLNEQSLDLGFGAGAVAGSTPLYPGVRLFAPLGDAVYEPLAARQRVVARQGDAQATQNTILLDIATGYLTLVGAEARLEILHRAEVDLAEIVRLTREFANAGQGQKSDADRALVNARLLQRQIREAEGNVVVASARLCRLLNLDPTARLGTPAGPVDQFRFIPEDTEPESLVNEALRARPELLAQSAQIQEDVIRVRQEQVRPFLPTISAGYSNGFFGGNLITATTGFGPLQGRGDVDVVAVWNFQNLGLGNRARVRRARAVVGEATAGYDGVLNQVRQEVIGALAEAQATARQLDVVRAALTLAEEGFRLESERIQQGAGLRPIELLDSYNQLVQAREDFLQAVIGYDIAQFRLFVAVGNTPTAGPNLRPMPPDRGAAGAVKP